MHMHGNSDWNLKLMAMGADAAALPIVASRVKENRIEYERAAFRVPPSGGLSHRLRIRLKRYSKRLQSAIAIGNRCSAITEWYENRAEGIEQALRLRRGLREALRSGE